MTDYILDHTRPIARELLSDMLRSDDGKPALQVRAYYYYKDARRRGLKLSISRVLISDFGFSYDMMNRHNGLVHLADMPRKPSPKFRLELTRGRARRPRLPLTLRRQKPCWTMPT